MRSKHEADRSLRSRLGRASRTLFGSHRPKASGYLTEHVAGERRGERLGQFRREAEPGVVLGVADHDGDGVALPQRTRAEPMPRLWNSGNTDIGARAAVWSVPDSVSSGRRLKRMCPATRRAGHARPLQHATREAITRPSARRRSVSSASKSPAKAMRFRAWMAWWSWGVSSRITVLLYKLGGLRGRRRPRACPTNQDQIRTYGYSRKGKAEFEEASDRGGAGWQPDGVSEISSGRG